MTDENKPDGGPAFPGGELPERPRHPVGMTLRDWFAGQALPMIASTSFSDYATIADNAESAAILAYAYADAMLKERSQ